MKLEEVSNLERSSASQLRKTLSLNFPPKIKDRREGDDRGREKSEKFRAARKRGWLVEKTIMREKLEIKRNSNYLLFLS